MSTEPRQNQRVEMRQHGISYPIPVRRSGSNEDPDCGFPSPPANTPPSCCRLTPAPDTSRCCWWGQAGRAGSPILPAQTPAPAAQTCSCFSSSQHHAPSRGCSTCEGSKTEKSTLIRQRWVGRMDIHLQTVMWLLGFLVSFFFTSAYQYLPHTHELNAMLPS